MVPRRVPRQAAGEEPSPGRGLPGRGPGWVHLAAPAPRRVLAAVARAGSSGPCSATGSRAFPDPGAGFPWTIFAVNVIGCFLLALLPAVAAVRPPAAAAAARHRRPGRVHHLVDVRRAGAGAGRRGHVAAAATYVRRHARGVLSRSGPTGSPRARSAARVRRRGGRPVTGCWSRSGPPSVHRCVTSPGTCSTAASRAARSW